MGPEPYLSLNEEKELVKWIEDLARCAIPLKQNDLLNTVQKIIKEKKRKTPFKDNRPGKTWINLFFKRNPSLTKREPESLSKGRAAVPEDIVKNWFSRLKEFLKEIDQEEVMNDPTRIFNGDETSFCLCPKTGKVIAPKGYKNVYQIASSSNEKETITVLIVCSASGKMMPPMVVFPYLRPPKDLVSSMPENWVLGRSETGWMRSETFYEYVANNFEPWLVQEKIKKPIVLFIGGHKSHLTMEELEKKKKRKEERLSRKVVKKKNVIARKTVKIYEKCQNCLEDLISDVEEDEFKNIECDTCTSWFHIKCTELKDLTYQEAIQKDFLCQKCL